ncbi:MAG TPA: TonB family protein [Pyrinomonadaceae bacterium]|jgi:TonB family protein
MRGLILTLFFLFTLNLVAAAQAENYNAPVKWERYKVSKRGVSVLLPKLPILIESSTSCSELETVTYAAYAREVVYTLRIVSKKTTISWNNCPYKIKFNEQSFESRVKEIRLKENGFDESKYRQDDIEVTKITSKNQTSTSTYWFFNDFKNKRWFELWATHRSDVVPDTKDFAASVKIEKTLEGIEIEGGSLQILGDLQENSSTKIISGISENSGNGNIIGKTEENKTDNLKGNSVQSSEKVENLGIVIVHKPFARYTDAARDSDIQGTVILKVTFLASGGVGSISAVSTLPYGLTEQAIAAAKKIVFLPPKRNKIAYSVTKAVSYSFTIY